jgi:hypothetical protein
MPRKKTKGFAKPAMSGYRNDETKQKNNPLAKIAAEGAVPLIPNKIEHEYNPPVSSAAL